MKRLALAIAVSVASLGAPAAFADDPFDITNAFTGHAVVSCGDLTHSDGTIDSAGVSSPTPTNKGHVASNGNIKMSGGALVDGDATAGPGKTVSNSGSSRVTGLKSSAASAFQCKPVDLTSLTTSLQTSNDNAKIPLSAQGKNALTGTSHTDFSLSGGDSVTLPAGTYYFTKFTLSGGSIVNIAGSVRILCTGTVSISGGSVNNAAAGGAYTPYRLRFWTTGTGFTLSSATMAGFIYAPNGTYTNSAAHLIGGVFANSVTVSGSSHVTRAIDDVIPQVTINTPADGAIVSDPSHVDVRGVVVENETVVTLDVNGQSVPIAADGTFQTTINLSGVPSPVKITAKATDAAGNFGQAQVSVTTVPPPTLTLTSPAPGSYVNTRVVNLTGGAGTSTTVTVNGTAATVANGVWTLTGFDLGADGTHTLTIVGTNVGGSSTISPILTLDTVMPSITASVAPPPNTAGWNKSDVTVRFTCSDSGSGIVKCPDDVIVTSEGASQAVTRSVSDRAGNPAQATAVVSIDKTAPAVAVTTPANGAVVTTPHVVVTGAADDAVTVTVNGVAASVDPNAHTFTAPLDLVEGSNAIAVTGTDLAGNAGSTSSSIDLDTRGPEVTITTPAANACLNVTSLDVRGTVTDSHPSTVKVTVGTVSVNAVVSNGTWMASVPVADDGKKMITVEATDSSGHVTSGSVSITIDRAAPSIVVTNNGTPFTGGFVNHPPSLFIRANDADASATLTVTLNGQPFVSGSTVSADGSYTLKATARDCAGNASPETSIAFTVDTVAPRILTLDPTNGSTITTAQKTVTGTFDGSDVKSLTIDGTPYTATINGASFSIAGVALSEGTNRFVLVATDNAGNQSRTPYAFSVKTTTPTVSITENGTPIAPNALFNRTITPLVTSNEAAATITATLDGNAYTSGTPIGSEGAHTLRATANDAYGHTSPQASAMFTIDRTPPVVTITSPADNSSTTSDHVDVRGTATGGDVASVVVNGVAASVGSDGSFALTNVAIDLGPNTIFAAATDRAGNTSSASATINRTDKLAIVLTSPADKTLTNRHTIIVAGQLLTPGGTTSVSINGTDVPVDVNGAFTKSDFALSEGTNTITATVKNGAGTPNSASVTVTADFTPPTLKVLAGGSDLQNDARFATAPSITLQTSDNRTDPVTTKLTVDGSVVTAPVNALADGGHALSAVARDAAGNETRIDRTFAIGAGTSSGGGCSLTSFDPANNSSIYTGTIKIGGRSGGASNVLVNNTRALMADGSFAATVTLQPGRNDITIQCADANGNATSDTPVTLTLYRYTDATITITSPANDSIAPSANVTVSGTVTDGVVSGDVNTLAFTPANGTYSVSNVPLANGINILTANAKTSSARIGSASVRVKYFGGAPQISITSPLPGTTTGATTIDVSGTYVNVDPSTIALSTGTPVQVTAQSDTTGIFIANGVALAPNAKTTIIVTGRSRTNATATASTDVTTAGNAAISIASPLDNTAFTSTTSSVHVTGTFTPIAGSQVSVNGVAATLDANGNFAADLDLTTATNASIPIVARVTTADGQSANDAIRIIRFTAPLSVVDTFPTPNAVEVSNGVLIVVRFSNPVAPPPAGALTLTEASGAHIDGETFVDNEIVSFAPMAPLTPGMHYTFNVGTTLKDLAGGTLASPYSLPFTVVVSAPAGAPTVDQTDASGCFTKTTITGTATVPGARVRLDVDGVTLQANSDATTGKFSFDFTFSGQPGFHIARVRQIASDGTLSAEKDVTYQISCAGPQVVASSLDRAAKKITINFSKPMKLSSLVASPGGTIVINNFTGTVSLNANGDVATVQLTDDVTTAVVTLTVLKSVQDANGANMAADYTQTFTLAGDQPTSGFISGAIYDATNGRPLQGATVNILTNITTDDHGRYTRAVGEGVYTIQASAPGYTTVWRQIVVPSGSGVIPIDIRLTKRGPQVTSTGAAIAHGGDTTVTKRVELIAPTGTSVTLTSAGAQSLAGLLPLGWSPVAAAEVAPLNAPLAGGKLTFILNASDVAAITAATQTLSLAQYDETRDEWRVVSAVANVGSDGRVAFDITTSGNYALVYPDKAPNLAHPSPARTGAPLAGVANPCTNTPDVCRMTSKSFDFTPKSVLPSGRAVANLVVDGVARSFPSGTAVQAFIDEQLNLADGRVVIDPPFATDLLIYRNFAGDSGLADFHLSPTTQAAALTLRDGNDHIRVVDYPGRIDRGALIGSEGGRVPGDDGITIDIPTGATTEPLHASASTITDLAQFASIQGFHIVGAFTFSLSRATEPTPIDADGDGQLDPIAPPSLLKPANATFTIPATTSQVVVAELLPNTAFGAAARLATQAQRITDTRYTSVLSPQSSVLTVDGIVRDGRYLILTADNPIAFAKGKVINAGTTLAVAAARVSTNNLGLIDITRIGGIFAIPVTATPAAPFTLTPRSTAIGDGDTYTAASSPAAGAIVDVGTLTLAAHPPQLTSLTPANGSVKNAGDPFLVTATFDRAIDTTSLANAITVVNLNDSTTVTGTISGSANTVTFTGASPLSAGTRYSITVAATIRATNGAAYGRTTIATFSTPAIPAGDNTIHRELITITIPDANGVSTITGKPGALPPGAQAVAVRRGNFFVTQYQTTVAADKSFTFSAGGAGADRITTSDLIDLQVIDATSRAIIAVIRLTPFVTADGTGFIAPTDITSTFTVSDGSRVTVPAGAFDQPTLITAVPSQKTALAAIPHFDDQLTYTASINITFDGTAKKHLDVEIPIPAGTDTSNKTFLLGWLGESIRGPRMMIVDTLAVANGKLTTADVSSGASTRATTFASHNATTSGSLTGADAKKYLIGVERSGIYAAVDIKNAGAALVWGVMDGLQSGTDLFWDTLDTLYASHLYAAERGRVAIPLLPNRKFEVVGVDASTGLTQFYKVYDPIAPNDPGASSFLANPNPPTEGPYPVFGTPFRVETTQVNVENIDLHDIRNFVITLSSGKITATPASPALDPNLRVTLLNVSSGSKDDNADNVISVDGKAGDRIALFIEQDEVDPFTTLSVVFSKKIYTGASANDDDINTYLQSVFTLQTAKDEPTPSWSGVPGARYRVDSGGLRVLVDLPSSLQRGNLYRLVIGDSLADVSGSAGGPGLRIGQAVLASGVTTNAISVPLNFRVRAPGGTLTSFQLYNSGVVRDEALNGNVLLIAALNGGLLAYDTADPASMTTSGSLIGYAPRGDTDVWSVASDMHGRIYTTGLTSLFGVLRSYRLEDFTAVASNSDPAQRIVTHRSGATLSFAPGAAANMELASSTILSDRPEAIPRRLQVLLQDRDQVFNDLASFKATTLAQVSSNGTDGEFEILTATVVRDAAPNYPYVGQRITVENMSMDMRWSADAWPGVPAKIEGVVARKTDRLRIVWNEKTYGVVTLFGYGIGVYDLNAIESNDDPHRPSSYQAIREMVRITNAADRNECHEGTPPAFPELPPTKIPDLTFTPEAAIITHDGTPDLSVYAVDASRGVLDVNIHPPTSVADAQTPGDATGSCSERASNAGLVFHTRYFSNDQMVEYFDPRIKKLRDRFVSLVSPAREPYVRFTGATYYHWTLEPKDNKVIAPATTLGGVDIGARGSVAGTRVSRDYLLVPGNEYGLLIVEIGGTPPDASSGVNPNYAPLGPQHLVDIIWIPDGCSAARAIPRTNLASVIDGKGRVLLVDLSRIDERFTKKPDGSMLQPDDLFPTAADALSSNGAYGVGKDDPRIVWKSETGVASGTLSPFVDPDTGMLFMGKLLTANTDVIAAIDPRVQMRVELAQPGGYNEVGGVVPLGIDPPQDIKNLIDSGEPSRKPDASLGAFRFELSLPGAIADQLTAAGNKVRVAVESERVFGATSEQTPEGFPRSHLRMKKRNGDDDPRAATNFFFKRLVPPSQAAKLRYQKGYNKIVSPWIVAIADPRASIQYTPFESVTEANKNALGCFACTRPQFLKGKTEADDVWELYTNGRGIAVRPDLCAPGTNCATNIFTGTPYAYLGKHDRLVARFATVMADTVRPLPVLVAAQAPPVAPGLLQETTYAHSGEVEASHLDMDFGGRNGWDVVIDRTYRSRTLGGTAMGEGWESSILKRLRPLPSGDVEYRDGAGEVWRFKLNGTTAAYDSPKGLYLKLTRTTRGYQLIDQKLRLFGFDSLGRLAYECDEFVTNPDVSDKGNIVRYLYDDSGRLSQIVDPVQRATTLQYYDDSASGLKSGLLQSITDWRNRKLDYDYNDAECLTTVKLVDVVNTSGSRPQITYDYWGGSGFVDKLELAPNLKTITDPVGGNARVTFTYDTSSGNNRDKVLNQSWAAPGSESATFGYTDTTTTVVDALNQTRTITLGSANTDYNADRTHIKQIDEAGVPVSTYAFGELPAGGPIAAIVPSTTTTRTMKFGYDDAKGALSSASIEGIRGTTYGYDAAPEGPGFRLRNETTTAIASSGGAPLSRDYDYQTSSNPADSGVTSFVKSITANGKTIDTPEASRTLNTTSTNDSIQSTTEYNDFGQPKHVTTQGGTDGNNVGSELKLGYVPPTGAKHAIGTVNEISEVGSGGETLTTQINYSSPSQIVSTDPRNVTTTTDLDAWDRPTHVTVAGPNLNIEENYEYDANGRLKFSKRVQDDKVVKTTYDYDAIGRVTSTSVDNVDVDGSPSTVTTSTSYQLAGGSPKIIRTLPKGAMVTDELDGLGRVTRSTTTTGTTSPIVESYAYDLAGNVVFETDNFTASAMAFDVHGRLIATANPDGTRTVASGHDGWGNPQDVTVKGTSGASVAHSTFNFTPSGRLDTSTTDLGTTSLQTAVKWDGAGRSTAASASSRIAKWKFDSLGRMQSAEFGDSANTFQKIEPATVTSFSGRLLTGAKLSEKSVPTQLNMTFEHDTLGNVTRNTLGSLAWEQHFDQSGNVTTANDPGRPATTYKHDARGSVTGETRADASALKYKYDAAGGSKSYADPAEETTTTTDLLGRPLQRIYPDGTTESFGYEGARLQTYTDRQKRSYVYEYETNTGRLQDVRKAGGELLEKYTYDDGGRLRTLTTNDAEITFENYDLGGRPHLTKQKRFGSGTDGGFGAAIVVDEFTQTHDYNEHGERTMFTMPYAGSVNGWTTQLNLSYDAAGNVTEIRRTVAGGSSSVMMSADYRNAGRPIFRNITTDSLTLGRAYSYDPNTGQLNEMKVTGPSGNVIAGSHVTFDGPSLQVHRAELLGISGARGNEFTYDARGRLQTSTFGKPAGAAPSIEGLTPDDFRNSITHTSTEPTEPPSVAFTPLAGKKIGTMTRAGEVRSFDYATGAERRDDGRYTYDFDTRGRLTTVTEKSATNARRFLYFYGATDRIVGRRAEYLTAGTWTLEDRSDILASDVLPAETTFVWDPISDQLLAVLKKGGGDLIRQIIHGGAGYDDPIEVTIADPGNGSVNRLYPIYDEAAGGSLQAIANANGDVVSRPLVEGGYGEDESALAGVAVDQITVKATKDSSGNLATVAVNIRLTEPLAVATITTGGRLAATLTNGTVVRSTTTAPTLVDNNTLHWTLPASEWTTLTAPPATALSIAVTNTLRASAWSPTTPILPPPTWAMTTRPVFTSTALPLEYRESLASLSDWIASVTTAATKPLYEIHSLAALSDPNAAAGRAMNAQRLLVAAGFQALPFQEPATGLVFARARWYDPGTGSFLSPDPLGYKDSSNLYVFGGGDPINERDPLGEGVSDWLSEKYHKAADAIDQAADDIRAGYQPVNASDDAGVGMLADVMHGASGFLRQGDETGTDLGNARSVGDYGMVASRQAYDFLPMEEGRALIQDWDQLDDATRARLVATGVSKTASALAFAKATQQLVYTAPAPPAPRGIRVNLMKPKAVLSPGRAITRSLISDIAADANAVAAEGGEITGKQFTALRQNLPEVARRSAVQNRVLRAEFVRDQARIVAEWERQTGRMWPKGATPHHIVPLESGGANKWYNIMPTEGVLPNHSLPGIRGPHGAGSVLRQTVQRSRRALPPGTVTRLNR